MFGTKVLARLVMSVLVATTMQTLVAGEPVGTTPPSNSIHDWLTKPGATASPAASSVVRADAWDRSPTAAIICLRR